jgi:hypothetical protein
VEIIERLEGHYEAQEVPFGIVYSWSPECLVAECGCGERVALTPSMSTCAGCETDHAAIVQEWLASKRPEPSGFFVTLKGLVSPDTEEHVHRG